MLAAGRPIDNLRRSAAAADDAFHPTAAQPEDRVLRRLELERGSARQREIEAAQYSPGNAVAGEIDPRSPRRAVVLRHLQRRLVIVRRRCYAEIAAAGNGPNQGIASGPWRISATSRH